MKPLLITAGFLLAGICVFGQKKAVTATPVAPSTSNVPVSTNGVFASFESSLVSGTISLNKSFKQGDGKDIIVVYSLQKNDPYFNGRKPIPISLSKQSYDSVFTKTTSDLAGKWAVMNQYITENKIPLSTEKGWIDIITYFNKLK